MQNLELSTTSILALFETSKEQRMDFALRVVDALENGTADPIKIHLQIKMMEDIIKLLNTNTAYKKAVLEAAQINSDKSFTFGNAKFEIKETGVKYDYSQCGDPVYAMLEQRALSATNALKERETFLKTVPGKGITLTEEETGEVCTVYPPSKSSTTSVAVTLK
jgi:hypothetical protein